MPILHFHNFANKPRPNAHDGSPSTGKKTDHARSWNGALRESGDWPRSRLPSECRLSRPSVRTHFALPRASTAR